MLTGLSINRSRSPFQLCFYLCHSVTLFLSYSLSLPAFFCLYPLITPFPPISISFCHLSFSPFYLPLFLSLCLSPSLYPSLSASLHLSIPLSLLSLYLSASLSSLLSLSLYLILSHSPSLCLKFLPDPARSIKCSLP